MQKKEKKKEQVVFSAVDYSGGSVVLAVVPQVHQSVRLELVPTQGALCL